MNALEESRLGIRAVDRDIAALFEKRMRLAGRVLEYKRAAGLPVLDAGQEARVLSRAAEDIDDPVIRGYYSRLLKETMSLSREYQESLLDSLPGVHLGRGLLVRVAEFFDVRRRVLVVTDEGVPAQYAGAVLSACPDACLLTVPGGESGKTMRGAELILRELLRLGFTRSDAIIAVGGGVVGDMAGFAAACYMRGIDYYNVPTTLLSQVDSSVGGKTAVNLGGVKNIVGAFHQPKGVLVDVDTLATLSPRLFAEGMAEMIKMAATCDACLFSDIESCTDVNPRLEDFIERALRIKLGVVRQDPEEHGLRAVLNFGHTVGHAVEAAAAGSLYHGECVAIGMMYMSRGEARERLETLLLRLGLPVRDEFDVETLMAYATSDKKKSASGFKTVMVSTIGSYTFETLSPAQLRELILKRKSQ